MLTIVDFDLTLDFLNGDSSVRSTENGQAVVHVGDAEYLLTSQDSTLEVQRYGTDVSLDGTRPEIDSQYGGPIEDGVRKQIKKAAMEGGYDQVVFGSESVEIPR